MTRLQYPLPNPDTVKPVFLFNPAWITVLAVLFFVLATLLGNPYFYDQGNSGRYLIGVLKTVDPALFPNDPVAEGLSGFESLFYSGLSNLLKVAGSGPEAIEPVMHGLYILAKIAFFVLLFWVVRGLTEQYFVFVLLAAWAVHAKTLPLGGTQLFANTLRHTEVAILIELAALGCLFRRRFLWFWFLAAAVVFIHALVALHLFLCLIPPFLVWWLIARPKQDKSLVLGLALAAGAILGFYLFMAPPPLSAEETAVFFNAKGDINHISLAGTSLFNWLELATILVLTTLAYWQVIRKRELMNGKRRRSPSEEAVKNISFATFLLIGGVLGGTAVALALSMLATTTHSSLLALIQPLRLFLWVVFCAHLLLAITTGLVWQNEADSDQKTLGIILLAYFLFAILGSFWRVAFAGLGVIYFLLPAISLRVGITAERQALPIRLGVVGVMIGIILATAIGLLRGRELPENLGGLELLLPIIIISFLIFRASTGQGWRFLAAGGLLLYSLIFASQAAYKQYEAVVDSNWDTVTRWAAENSGKADRFISTYTADTFRVRAMRTAISHNFSALAWVAPEAFQNGQKQAAQIREGFQNGQWQLDYLSSLAQSWDAAYLILDGPYEPAVEPVFQSGRFSVVAVETD